MPWFVWPVIITCAVPAVFYNAARLRRPPSSDLTAITALVALCTGLFAAGVAADHEEGAARAQMRDRVQAKYRVTLDKDARMITNGSQEPVSVIAFVKGEMRQCSMQVVKNDPYVFCGNGTEADHR